MSELVTVYKCRKCGYFRITYRAKCSKCGDDLYKTSFTMLKPQQKPGESSQGEIRLYRGLFKVRIIKKIALDGVYTRCEVEAVESYPPLIEKGSRWKTFLRTLYHQVKDV